MKKHNSKGIITVKNKTIQSYLDKYLYPTLQKAVDELISELESKYDDDLNREFNKNFFENRAQIIKKQKELLYMEKDSDFSDSEYDHFVKSQLELIKENETEIDNEDLENSMILAMAEKELNEEDDMKSKFDPLDFLSSSLKHINFNKNPQKESDKIYFD